MWKLSDNEIYMTMMFSIVIPLLNSPYIDRVIEAIKKQDFSSNEYEIIIVGVDDFNLIQESRYVRFDRTNKGLPPAIARNRGAAQARGDNLIFLDADCFPQQNWLSIIAERFNDPYTCVLGGGVDFRHDNYWMISDNLSMFHEFLLHHPAGEKKHLPSLNLSIRRYVFNEIGGFDSRYPKPSSEDTDLTIRLRRQGYRLYFEPRAMILHSPTRDSLPDMLRHSFYQGKYSTKVDPRYRDEGGLVWPFHTRLGVTLFAPLLALVVVIRIFRKNVPLRKYWYTIPAVYLSKLAWCLGAALRPSWNN